MNARSSNEVRSGDAAAPAAGAPRDELLSAWLEVLCRMVPRVDCAIVVRDGAVVARSPAGGDVPEAVRVAADRATTERIAIPAEGGPEATPRILAGPLIIDGRSLGAVSLRTIANDRQVAVVLKLLDWSRAWLQLLVHEAPPDVPPPPALSGLWLPSGEDTVAFAISTCNALADHLGARRVWLGAGSGTELAVIAVSGQSRLDANATLVALVREAMAEARAQGGPLHHPGPDAEPAAIELRPAHAALLAEAGGARLCTVPLDADDAPVGALLVELDAARGPSGPGIDALAPIADEIAARLALHRQLAPGPLGRAERGAARLMRSLRRRGATRARAGLAAVLVAAALLGFGRGEYEVRADAYVEGRAQLALSAPFDGYVAASAARAGDEVTAGQLIASLDPRDLELELSEVESELGALDREYRKALAEVDQAATRIAQARIAQAQAREALLRNRLAQVELRAPVDGVLLSGDLSRAVGSPVTKGDLLFEIAPLDALRLVLLVPEADIDEISAGQTGRLALAALPDARIPFAVERVSGVHDPDATEDVLFRVEASLPDSTLLLRPGMEGTVRVAVGDRSLWWIYTHELTDWIRLMLWRWLP